MLQFVNECLLIVLISYPILFFLIGLHPRLTHVTPILLLGLTVVSTLIVSATFNVILLLWGETEGGDAESWCREKGEAPGSENKLIPEGLV
ncbi:hypothetical protein DFS33DRAFT_1387824 [Desarmillaria ectypa]|nr:hypothetical protein DFS33DRAFT_1387824 [Desarmillaria ectypa]